MVEATAHSAHVSDVVLPLVLDTSNGDPGFVRLVTSALDQFDPNELPAFHQIFWHWVCCLGANEAQIRFKLGLTQAAAKYPDRRDIPLADIALDCGVGDQVFRAIPEADLRRYLPVNDVEFKPCGKTLKVTFRSLLKSRTVWGTTFYSRHRPVAKFGNRSYVIGFSKHAIEQTCDRINPHWMTYAGLGDVFAYFDKCVHFEPCYLNDGSPAFTFWDEIGDERFWQFKYVREVLGEENYSPPAGKPYFRVGYCSVVFEGEFAKATTLLFPGYSKTPEALALRRSRLPEGEKRRLSKLAEGSNRMSLVQYGDLSALKWFHDNGVPQVIQSHRPHFMD